MVADVEADEHPELDDLCLTVVLAQPPVELLVYALGSVLDQITEFEGELLGISERVAVAVVVDPFIDQLFS